MPSNDAPSAASSSSLLPSSHTTTPLDEPTSISTNTSDLSHMKSGSVIISKSTVKSSWKPKGKAVLAVDTAPGSGTDNGSDNALTISGSVMRTADREQFLSFEQVIIGVSEYFKTAKLPSLNVSTVSAPHADADLLYELDSLTSRIIGNITRHQNESVTGTPVVFQEYDRSLLLNKFVSLSELQRFRRQFVKASSQGGGGISSQTGASFIDYIAGQL